jgi:hypothetical protein
LQEKDMEEGLPSYYLTLHPGQVTIDGSGLVMNHLDGDFNDGRRSPPARPQMIPSAWAVRAGERAIPIDVVDEIVNLAPLDPRPCLVKLLRHRGFRRILCVTADGQCPSTDFPRP